MFMRHPFRPLVSLLAVGAVVAAVFVASPAQAATLTLASSRVTSGTAPDAASTCPTQGQPNPSSHCAGYDTSTAATDQILRTQDTAQVRFDFEVSAADTGIVISATLPEVTAGTPAAVWTAIPASCATGSALADANRTLNCRIANPTGPVDGSVTATLRMATATPDAFTVSLVPTIDSDGGDPVSAAGDVVFTSSSAPFWDLRKNTTAYYNRLPAPFQYNSPDGVPGIAVPTSTVMAAAKVGGYEPLAAPVTWTESVSNAPDGVRLLDWGNYGNGCGPQSRGSAFPNAGYSNTSVAISNQITATNGTFQCSQPGGAGTPVTVSWTDPPASPVSPALNMWVMLWVPVSALPVGNSTFTVTAGDFEPDGVSGDSNYLGGSEPTTNNARQTGTIVNQDANTTSKNAITDRNPVVALDGTATSTVTRGSTFQTSQLFINAGTVPQTGLIGCDRFDSTVATLTDFGTNPPSGSTLPAGTYAVPVTTGSTTDPVLASPYEPGPNYNGTSNFAVAASGYRVEFAAGDFETGTPTTAPQPPEAINDTGCGDADTATGWHTSPTDPAIVAYATGKGLSSAFDVIDRVRVVFTGTLAPGSTVGVKMRFTARPTFRDATTQAGVQVPATTKLFDSFTFAYDQLDTPAWTANVPAGPVIAGTLGVTTRITNSASPTGVQAGAPGQDTSTYTLTPTVRFGEDVTTPQIIRVFDYVPSSMKYVTGSASIEPDQVLRQADGTTLLVWDLGRVSTPPSTSITLPAITLKTEANPLAPAPSTSYNGAVVEAVAADGTQVDTRPIANCGAQLTLDVPATPSVPVATTTKMQPPVTTGGCGGQGQLFRYAQAAVTIGNAFITLAADKTADRLEIQPGDSDGVGGVGVGWSMTYANYSAQTLDGVDIVDVDPFNGDGRTPASSFSGTFRLKDFATDDTLSTTPNALPTDAAGPYPTRAGTTFYFTAAAPASVSGDPYDPTNLAGGTTKWCLQTDFGTAGCPANVAAATGIRIISGALATQQKQTVTLGFATAGNADGDVYTNEAGARAIGASSLIPISGDAITVVASAITGLLWDDANGDGVVEAGEDTRLGNVDVEVTGTDDLGDAVSTSATTAADGTYTVPNLRPGTYTVAPDQAQVRALDPAYAVTFDPDSGTTRPDGKTEVTLASGTTVTSQDFGFATQSVSGLVYRDDDDNGAQDPGEAGVGGASVTVTGTDDLGADVDRTTTTAGDGSWSLTLRPGTYTVAVAPVAGLLTGLSTAGSAGGTAGDLGSGTISNIVLDAANNAVGYLVGELAPEIVSGDVYLDANGNGAQDPGEAPIPNVRVTLTGTDATGAVTRTADSDADGGFLFPALRNGTYTITETQPAGYLDGTATVGASVGTPAANRITGVVVDGANTTNTYAFGEIAPATLRGTVFHDLNADGARAAGEPGVSATVTLTGTDDLGTAVNVPVVSGADGSYQFLQLRPGTYTLTQTLPTGYLDGRETAGSAGGRVDDAAPGSRTIADIVIAQGAAATGYLFADVRAASLAGVVYSDANDNGAQDASETGIPGVTVTVTGADDFGAPVTRTLTTAAGGTYTTPLRPGTYTVTETQPAGYLDGRVTAGTAGGTVARNEVSGILLGSGVTATGYLFGERTNSSLAGTVFADDDGDGAQGTGETGIEGVTLELLSATGAVLQTTTTDADGAWTFEGFTPGTYGVRETQPDGYFDGTSVIGDSGGTTAANGIAGIEIDGAATGYAFTEYRPSTIRGTVWHDSNDNGAIDPGEDGIAGVTVDLSGASTATATTNSDGTFVFAGLDAGTYTLTETAPDDFAEGRAVVGSAGGTAASPTSITDITVARDTDNTGYGFSERTPGITLDVTTQTKEARVAPGPYVAVGSAVAWAYTVGNPGETALDGVTLTDDRLGVVDCPATTLAAGATMTCEASGTAKPGQYENTATVTADVVGSAPAALPRAVPAAIQPFAIADVTSSATSHYFGVVKGLSAVTTLNGKATSSAPGPILPAGKPATLAVTVTNTGNAPTVVDTITVPSIGTLTCDGSTTLAPGDSVTCSVTWTPSAGVYAAAVVVTGHAPDSVAVDGGDTPILVAADGVAHFRIEAAAVVPPAGGGSGGGGSGGGDGGGGSTPTGPGSLAFTGTSIALALALGLGLTFGGVLLVRRRRERRVR